MPYTGEGMPDSEMMTTTLLKEQLPANVTVTTTPPVNWATAAQTGGLVVVYRISGDENVPGYLETSQISFTCFHETKRDAKDLANLVLKIVHEACRDGYSVPGEGAFTHYRPGSGPVPIPDGLSGKHSDTRMQRCNANLTTRPLYRPSP